MEVYLLSGFCHLHLHTCYSLLDGACKINDVLQRAVELGQSSLVITDHGVMYGAIDFYKKAKSVGNHLSFYLLIIPLSF